MHRNQKLFSDHMSKHGEKKVENTKRGSFDKLQSDSNSLPRPSHKAYCTLHLRRPRDG